jgi:hypothetical protein
VAEQPHESPGTFTYSRTQYGYRVWVLVVDRECSLLWDRTSRLTAAQEICYSHNGYYPYPIFALLTTYQRIGLFALSGATMWVAGGALRALYAYANGYELTEALEKRQRARKMGSEGKWD